MPSPAVRAKDALVVHLNLLTGRIKNGGASPANLPSMPEWDQLTALAREALKKKKLPTETGFHLRWAELRRLEIAYRTRNSTLAFTPWYEHFVEVLESSASPFSLLIKRNWATLEVERRKQLGARSEKAKVIDWMINLARTCPSFDAAATPGLTYPNYEDIRQTANPRHTRYGFPRREVEWIEIGKVIAATFLTEAGRPVLSLPPGNAGAAKAGYEQFIWLLKAQEAWRKGLLGFHDNLDAAIHRLNELQAPWVEARTKQIRFQRHGIPRYADPQVDDGGQQRRGQVPTIEDRRVAATQVKAAERKRARTAKSNPQEQPPVKRRLKATAVSQRAQDDLRALRG